MYQLTAKEQKLVNKIAAGKGKQQAGIEAGYLPGSAHVTVSRKLKTAKIQSALDKAYEKAGISDARLAKKHAELLDAKKTVSAVCGKDAGAGTVDFVEVDDYPVQAKALDMALKRKGAYPKEGVIEGNVNLNFSFGDK